MLVFVGLASAAARPPQQTSCPRPKSHREIAPISQNETIHLLRLAKSGSTTTLTAVVRAKDANPQACARVVAHCSHVEFHRRAIIVIREPTERFVSAYYYSKARLGILRLGQQSPVGWANKLLNDTRLRRRWLAAPTWSTGWDKTGRRTQHPYGLFRSASGAEVLTRAECDESSGHKCGFVPQAEYHSASTHVVCLPRRTAELQAALDTHTHRCKLPPEGAVDEPARRTEGVASQHEAHLEVGEHESYTHELREAVEQLFRRDYALWNEHCASTCTAPWLGSGGCRGVATSP
jgi:hypothetical protein